MTLIETFKKSVYSPEFYRGLPAQKLSSSIKYFYSLVIVLSLIFTVVASITLVPAANIFFKSLGPNVLNTFPDGFAVKIESGRASSNLNEPFTIPIPEDLRPRGAGSEKSPQSFLVVDTRNQFAAGKFDGYDTLVLLSSDSLAMRDQNGEVRVLPLNQAPDTVIDKPALASFINKVQPLAKWVAPFVIFGTFIVLLFVFSGKLVYLLFGALLVMIIGRLNKVKLGYKNSYKVALYAMSPGLALTFFLFALLPGLDVPYLFTIALIVFAWLNLKPVEEKKD